MGVSVVFEGGSDPLEVVPGQEAVQILRVENTGMVVDRVLVDVLGDAAEWTRIEPAQVNLLPGAVERVAVSFQPPRAASTAPGEVPYGLRVMSTEDPEGSVVEEGVVVVGEYGELGARLVPRSATGRRSARFRMVVENHGNRPEDVRIEPLDPEGRLGFKPRPSVFVAQPGTATFVRVKTVPRKTFFKGPNRTLPFEVTALPDRGDAATADGVMVEKQTLPEWMLPTLGVLAILCGLLLVLWFTVLRPVVNSAATAESNASSAAAQAQHAAGSAQSAAKNAANSAKSGAAPTALSVKLAAPDVLTGSSDLATAVGTTSSGAAATPQLVWTSSNPSVATVTQKGLVTAVSPGTATITATSAGSPSSSPGATPSPSATGAEGTAFSLAGDATPTATVAATPGSTTSVVSGSVTIDVVGPVSVSTAVLPQGVLGKTYSESLGGAGGTGTYTWSVSQGELPPGFTLSPDGVLSGTPTTVGTTTFKVQLANAGPPAQFTAKTFSLAIVDAPAVDTSSLPGATVGGLYTETLTAVYGTAPYSWALVPGQGVLPNGLVLNSTTGVISGTPTATGTYAFSVQVRDSATPSQSATQQLTIAVADELTIGTPATLPIEGVRNSPYSLTLNAFGGTQPYTWSVASGNLPLGLTLNSASGVISGTPTVTAATKFTVQVLSPGPPAQTATETVTLTVVTAPAVDTSSLPGGVTGTVYTQQTLAGKFGTTNKAGGYTWTVVPGQGVLPTSLKLSSAGVISGTPSATGTFAFTVQLTDSTAPAQTATQHLSITVTNPLQVTTAAVLPADGVVNAPYSVALSGIGGTTPYTWSISAGSLPAGLTLNSSTGVISGTPTAAGAGVAFTVHVADSSSPALSASEPVTLTVVTAPAVDTSSLPGAITNATYSQNLVGVGGTVNKTGGYAWSLVPGQGALPSGLSLTSAGLISGTPSVTGTFAFVVQLTDSTTPNLTATEHLSIAVTNPLIISTQSLPGGVVNAPYTRTLTATGGTQPYTWSVSSGALPAGLTLDASTGVISGTPTAGVAAPFTVHLTDSSVPVQITTQPISLTVVTAPAVGTSSLPGGITGTAYTPQTLTGDFGTKPYTWSLVPGQGVLPGDLALNPNTGVISGTPNAAGTYAFVVQLTDTSAPTLTATQHLSIVIANPLSVSTLELPGGVVNSSYSQQLSATGGTGPFTWSVSSGALPAGLSLNPSSGAITGTPSAAGTASFAVTAKDSGNPQQAASSTALTLVVVNPLIDTTSSLSPAADGQTYTAQLVATGGSAPYAWELTGTLPKGLILSSSGEISGTPTQTGVFPFTVQTTDGSSPPLTTTDSLSLTVTGSLRITTPSLPDPIVDEPYTATLSVTGGTGPYTWSLGTGSTLPTGLTLDPLTGVISGTALSTTPTTPTPAPITFVVTDTGPPVQTTSQALSLIVGQSLSFSMPAPTDAVIGQSYSLTPLSPSGGSGEYLWAESGTLPDGLTFSSETGTISGTVSATATPKAYPFQLTLKDATKGVQPQSDQLSITVVNPLSGSLSYNWTGTFNTAFSQTVQPTGGQGPYSFASTGTLPSWLSLDATTGVVSGTPDAQCSGATATTAEPGQFTCPTGSYSFSVKVTDQLGEHYTTLVALTVNTPQLVVTFTSSTTQTTGTPFSFSAGSPSGGYGDSAYQYTATGLPCSADNVCDQIDPNTGQITGTLSSFGKSSYTVTVTITQPDPIGSSGNTFVASYTETIDTVAATSTGTATATATP